MMVRSICPGCPPGLITIALVGSSTPALIIGASMGGDEMRTITITEPFGAQAPTFGELRFHATAAASSEVVGFRWFGGDYDNALSSSPSEDTVKASFSSLGFLE